MQATSRRPGQTALAIVLLLLAGACGAASNAPDEAAVDALARAWLIRNDGIGLSVGVYDNGQRRFYNYGTTQLDGNVVPTKDTVYDIGPVGKTMTGQILARAIVEGRATLEDDVAKYLDGEYPNLANGGQRILLRHLASMSSQLADNIPDVTQVRKLDREPLSVTRMRVFSNYSNKEFLRQLRRVAPTRPPGEEPGLSNVSSQLLGIVLERIYGEPFEKILAREIEKPLRMGSGANPAAKLLATGYTRDNEVLPPYGAPTQFAVNSLRYSVDDLLRYASWQLVERDASVKLAHQPLWSTPDGRASVGFYWIVGESPLGRRLTFSGTTYGFASYADLYPDARVAVVLLSNKNTEGAQESLRALSANIAALARPGGRVSPQPSSADAPQPDR
jgi:CubicO group peptidase (beta-lactamase class C family)